MPSVLRMAMALLCDRDPVSTASARPSRLLAAVLACAAGAAFWGPSIGVGRGWFPAPLDDVYIHFDFARSLAQGHPFEWIAGQGYSSGETAPLYAVVLGVGWALGLRGRYLGLWAALVAVLAVASLVGSVRRLVRPHGQGDPCPPWLAWLAAVVPISIGIVDWALFSGMEVALFAAVLGRALEALSRVARGGRGGLARGAREWRLGGWGAALCLLRPEAGSLVAVFALAAARGARDRSALAVLARVGAPGALATGAVLGLNLLATGDARSAGAQLKLLSSNPYLSDVDRARVFVENLVTFWVKVARGELSVVPGALVLLALLVAVALASRAHRLVAGASVAGAVLWTLLVSWNGNAPHHNFRYYAPALVLFATAASLGIATLASVRGPSGARVSRALAALLGAGVIAVFAARVPAQARHFRSASANIRDQHVEVGTRIARLPADARVLLGDAGAIPYVSERAAIDALGLGGYQRMPFAHAAVHGEAAIAELIERLPPARRPTHLALYPNWFGVLTSRFGQEVDRVTIQDNVICGGPTKVIYRADWSSLDDASTSGRGSAALVDALDVGDVVDEAEHAYVAPLPHGGWTTLDVLRDAGGNRRFDGGRTIPDGAAESFVVKRGDVGPLTVRVRVDANARGVVLRARGAAKDLALEAAQEGAWREGVTSLDGVRAGETLTLEARGGEYRDYHVWIERASDRGE